MLAARCKTLCACITVNTMFSSYYVRLATARDEFESTQVASSHLRSFTDGWCTAMVGVYKLAMKYKLGRRLLSCLSCLTGRQQAPACRRQLLPAPGILLHAGWGHLCAVSVLQGTLSLEASQLQA